MPILRRDHGSALSVVTCTHSNIGRFESSLRRRLKPRSSEISAADWRGVKRQARCPSCSSSIFPTTAQSVSFKNGWSPAVSKRDLSALYAISWQDYRLRSDTSSFKTTPKPMKQSISSTARGCATKLFGSRRLFKQPASHGAGWSEGRHNLPKPRRAISGNNPEHSQSRT